MVLQENAIFKISYGMFFLGCEDNGKSNVCVVNTVAQITQEPLGVSVTILKDNLTHDMILSANKFSVGIMGVNVSMDTINHFGGVSGRVKDKLSDFPHSVDGLGNPLISEGCVATLCCNVTQTVDLGTHTTFIADLVGAEVISNDEPLTYGGYRNLRAGIKLVQNSDDEVKETWQCTVCHYVYDGEVAFEDLPDDYICPICKKPKSAFVKI